MPLKNIIPAMATAIACAVKNPRDLLEDLNPEQQAAVTHNEGPILVAAVAGAGKCITGDTIVATTVGPRRIDECKDIGMVSHSVDTATLDVRKANGTWLDMGVSQIIEIETSNGFKIKGTPEHPLLVWRGEPVWVRLDQLALEDLLMLHPGYGADHGEQVIDPEEAYLLGLMMGDGWTCRREAKGNTISWSRGGEHLPTQFYNLVQRFWTGTPIERVKPGTNSVSHSWGNKATYNRLYDLGCAFSSARDKRVPAWLVGASPAERIRFLQGYFDTDGSASSHEVEAVSASKHLARDVHQMLLALGVVSRLSPKTVKGYDHTYWRIIISGDQLRLFSDMIGFRYEKDKASAMSLIVAKPTNPNKGCYPMIGNLLMSLKDQWSARNRWNGQRQALDGKAVADYLHNRRAPSKEKLLSMINECVGPVADMLRNLSNFYLDPVASIKDSGSEHVYDFTIPTTHSFIANGIVSHNTKALVHRIAYLVAEHGVDPARILAVTFSKKGADEMNERLVALLGETEARVGTFHSVALQICKAERPEVKEWTIDDKNKYHFCIKDAVGFRHMDWKQADATLIEHFIGLCKANMARPGDKDCAEIAQAFYMQFGPKAVPYRLMEAYQIAEDLRKERQLLGFDDMMFDAAEMLRDDPAILERWASRWDYVLQDEAQDQNKVQLVMGELLAKAHRNYLLVGDPGQTIFSWRGAMPQMLLSFEERWESKVVKMNRNYRCGKIIIETANKVLDAMDPETKLDMHMVCERQDTEGEIIVKRYQDLDEEAEGIVGQIRQLIADGKNPKDSVVLYRTNAQSRAPEEALIGARIPYRIIGGTNFYERKEVKDLLAYLRVADGRGDLDDVARCINAPFRYLGKATVDKIREEAKSARALARKAGKRVFWPEVVRRVCAQDRIQRRQQESADEWADLIKSCMDRIEGQRKLIQPVDTNPVLAFDDGVVPVSNGEPEGVPDWDAGKPVNILEDIVMATRYTDWLIKDEGEESTENSRVSNVRELIRAARRFPTVKELLDYIDEIVESSKRQRKGEAPNKVTLTTIHRSKGLEWQNVFIVGVNDGILPHARCEDPEEERRLFYVGVTRARDFLHISMVREIATKKGIRPVGTSMFIEEAGLSPIEVVEACPIVVEQNNLMN